jgi:SAM-dependent methyltransferase
MDPAGENSEQIEYWNQRAGPKWVTLHEQLDAQLRPLGRRALERGSTGPGDRVLDVGCGCGDSTVEIARLVGPEGAVTGVDVSEVMLRLAEERAEAAGASNARFLKADAQTHPFEEGAFDLLYSRFGVMFFTDPRAAFANLRHALVPGGRLAFVCWQAIAKNPWMLVPLLAASKHVTLPEPPAPDAPGPFAFADSNRVQRILEEAGFAHVAFEAVEETLFLGGGSDLDRAVSFVLEIGPTAAILEETEPEKRTAVAGAVRDALEPHATAQGVRLPCSAWIATAQRV